MNLIDQIAQEMQTVLTTVSDAIAKATGLMKRQRKLTGAKVVQTLVFGFVTQGDARCAQKPNAKDKRQAKLDFN